MGTRHLTSSQTSLLLQLCHFWRAFGRRMQAEQTWGPLQMAVLILCCLPCSLQKTGLMLCLSPPAKTLSKVCDMTSHGLQAVVLPSTFSITSLADMYDSILHHPESTAPGSFH